MLFGGIYWRNKKKKKRLRTRSVDSQEDRMKGKWEASGATEHSKDMVGLIGCSQKQLQKNWPTYTNVE